MNIRKFIRMSVVITSFIMIFAMMIVSVVMLFGWSKPEHPENLNQATVGGISLLWLFLTLMAAFDFVVYYRKEDWMSSSRESASGLTKPGETKK